MAFSTTSHFCTLFYIYASLLRVEILNENSKQTVRSHNVVIVIITISCIGAIIESITQGWEIWVPPLIGIGVITCWGFHLNYYKEPKTRENFYIIFSMLVAFYHGVHATSYFDVIIISVLLMATATLMKRREYMPILLIEYFIIMIAQTVWARMSGAFEFDALMISRIILHFVAEVCIYKAFMEMLFYQKTVEDRLNSILKNEENDRTGMEDFLVNISHELRTPVNVINGMSSLILKKERRDDVISIRDAGRRLSHQIEDIQDYSEIQRGDAVLELDRYSITSLLNDLVINFNGMTLKKDIEFVVDLDPDVPAMMMGDAKKIRKIITHLMDNAFKYTKKGGVYLKVSCIKRDYGVNLIIEITDTGVGMSDADRERVAGGSYQIDKKRNRSTGGIGLGLAIVFGFTRLMEGFVSIESTKNKGTTVRVSVVQEVLDPSPCLVVETNRFMSIAFHVFPDKFGVTTVREFYKSMASNLAQGLRLNLYSAPNLDELKKLLDAGNITHIFMGVEEYNSAPLFFDELSKQDIIVTVSAGSDFEVNKGSGVVIMPKPLYGYPVTKVLNGEFKALERMHREEEKDINLEGIKTLIVDDEPMNLVVATGLFKEYKMIIDTAESGKEALSKYESGDYDVVFMDHMMPEMDGIEAMKKMKFIADQKGKNLKIIALTANAISGAREMFMKEGFDGFISKPISIQEFERVMSRVLLDGNSSKKRR